MLATKYRVRLKNNRIVGPFGPEQIHELYLKGHIDGSEDAQIFPGGNWETVESFPELMEHILRAISKGKTTTTPEPSLTFPTRNTNEKLALPKVGAHETSAETKVQVISPVEFQEFKYEIDKDPVEDVVDYQELEKNYQANEENRKKEEEFEKTRIRKVKHDEPLERTVVRPNAIPFPVQEAENPPEESEALPPTPVEPEVGASDKTQVLTLEQSLPELSKVAQEADQEIELMIIEREKEEEAKAEALAPPPLPKEKKESVMKKKGMKPIVLLAFLAIFVVVLFPENEKKIGDIKPEFSVISFPVAAKYEDKNKAATELKEGVKLYSKGTYKDRLKASDKFKNSLEAKFEDNPQALGWLVLTYAELFPNVQDSDLASANLFRLIQLSRGRILTDINVALGSALFYGHIKKYNTATTIVENFLRVKNKPTSKFFSIYLDLLMKSGRFVDAGQVYTQLAQVKDPPSEVYLPMARYLSQDGKKDDAKKLLETGLKKFPNSVPLFLEYCSYLLAEENFPAFEKALSNLKQTSAENSPSQISKYLEYMGMLGIIKKKSDLAADYFKKALEIQESDELRSKLSSLELGGSQKVENLIRESKIIDLIGKSRTAENQRRWDDAFKLAIDASDLADNYIPAQIWLSHIQIKRGYFNGAIQTLERLQKDNPQNTNVNYSLIKAYIEARKFDLAQRLLGQLSATKAGRSSEFAFLMGTFYKRNNNLNLALKWFQDSYRINPVNDQAYYELADIYFTGGKVDRSKSFIAKAIELDPENSVYHALSARILYEENVDTAIGYLRDVLESKVDDPFLIGEIAILYHKSGRFKEFEAYQKKFGELTNPTTNFYEYLIQVARQDDNAENLIKYGNALLKINPGSMEIRLSLGEAFYTKGAMKEAFAMFESVKERLPSYPRVNYWIAKVYLSLKDYPSALKASQEEIKFNPMLEHGHFILGETYKSQQKWPEALLSLEKALSLNGSSVETLFSLAWIKHRQNYPNIARDFYEKIVKIEPGNAEANKQLGLVYKDLGQGALAIEHLKIYLDLNPGANDRNEVESLIRQLQ